MVKDNRDILAVLKSELNFLEQGGYADGKRNAWRPIFLFEDSPTCPNYNDSSRPHPCTECALLQLVPAERPAEGVPCRHIVLNEEGQTIDDLYRTATQPELEWTFMKWLRTTIKRLEKDRNVLGDRRNQNVPRTNDKVYQPHPC
jgi:hypothetical protein